MCESGLCFQDAFGMLHAADKMCWLAKKSRARILIV